jgi:hypothetical protein
VSDHVVTVIGEPNAFTPALKRQSAMISPDGRSFGESHIRFITKAQRRRAVRDEFRNSLLRIARDFTLQHLAKPSACLQ